MSYIKLDERHSGQSNASADINQLNENIEYLKGLIEELQTKNTELENSICVFQVVQNHVIDPYIYSYSQSRTDPTIFEALTTSITTKKDNSRIRFEVIFYTESNENTVYFLQRSTDLGTTWTEIGSGDSSTASTRQYGIGAIPYDNQDINTIHFVAFQYIDEDLNVEANTEVTYRICAYDTSQTVNFTLNRTVDDEDGYYSERTASNVTLTEVR